MNMKLIVANNSSGEAVGIHYISSVSIKAIKRVMSYWVVVQGSLVEDITICEADHTDNQVKFLIEEYLKRLEKYVDNR